MPRVESTVVWSSMSSVTVVPARVGRGADRGGVVQGDPVAVARQRLAERRELDRHLDGVRQAEVGDAVEQSDVREAGGPGVDRVGDVLAEVVHGDQQPALDQRTDRRRRGTEVVTRDEATDETPGGRVGGDQAADPRVVGDGEHGRTEHGRPPGVGWMSGTVGRDRRRSHEQADEYRAAISYSCMKAGAHFSRGP